MSTVQTLTDGWAALFWAVTWQLAGLAALAWVCERALRLRQARARHALWWFVLLAPLVLAPARMALIRHQTVLRIAAPAPVARTFTAAPAAFGPTAPPPHENDTARGATASPAPRATPQPWWRQVRPADMLLLAWLLGCLVLALRLLVGHVRVRRMLAQSEAVEDAATLDLLRSLCAEAAVTANVDVRTSAAVGAPLLYGLWRPVIVVPEDWVGALEPDELRALLAHEVAHVKRRDFAANLAQRAMEVLLFFHPLAWIASRRITLAREELCDAWALAQAADAASYARSLTWAAERAHASIAAASVGVAESKFTLLRRVEAIMLTSSPKRLGRPIAIGLAAVLVVSGGTLAAVQVREPQGGPPGSQTTQQERCVSNIRQLGLACLMYARDNGGTLPPAARWCDAIRVYLRSEVFHQCPADNKKYSYAMNSNLSSKKRADIKAGARTVLLFESTQGRKNAHDVGKSWPVPPRHVRCNSVCFADGHSLCFPERPDFRLHPGTAAESKAASAVVARRNEVVLQCLQPVTFTFKLPTVGRGVPVPNAEAIRQLAAGTGAKEPSIEIGRTEVKIHTYVATEAEWARRRDAIRRTLEHQSPPYKFIGGPRFNASHDLSKEVAAIIKKRVGFDRPAPKVAGANLLVLRLMSPNEPRSLRWAWQRRGHFEMRLVPKAFQAAPMERGSSDLYFVDREGNEVDSRVVVGRSTLVISNDVPFADAQIRVEGGEAIVVAALQPEAAARMGEISARAINRWVVFVMDGAVISAPVIRSRLGGKIAVVGGFRGEAGTLAASQLAACLKSGPLPTLVVEARGRP